LKLTTLALPDFRSPTTLVRKLLLWEEETSRESENPWSPDSDPLSPADSEESFVLGVLSVYTGAVESHA
jgi:hypothetical protein